MRLFCERVPGTKHVDERPQAKAACDDAAGPNALLLVAALSRLGRNPRIIAEMMGRVLMPDARWLASGTSAAKLVACTAATATEQELYASRNWAMMKLLMSLSLGVTASGADVSECALLRGTLAALKSAMRGCNAIITWGTCRPPVRCCLLSLLFSLRR